MTSNHLTAIARARTLLASGEGRVRRESNHLSLRDFAEALGVEASTVLRWESGEQRPRAEHALKYAQLIGRIERFAARDRQREAVRA